MTIDFHSAFKASESLRPAVKAVQELAKSLYFTPAINFEHVQERIQNEVDTLLKNSPSLLKELKVKLRSFPDQSHIDVIQNNKEHSAVLITIVFRKGAKA